MSITVLDKHFVQPLDKYVHLSLTHANGSSCSEVGTGVVVEVSPPVSELVRFYCFLRTSANNSASNLSQYDYTTMLLWYRLAHNNSKHMYKNMHSFS